MTGEWWRVMTSHDFSLLAASKSAARFLAHGYPAGVVVDHPWGSG